MNKALAPGNRLATRPQNSDFLIRAFSGADQSFDQQPVP